MNRLLLLLITVFTLVQTAFAVDKTSLNIEFFDRFNDKYLSQYILEALENNHTTKQATARVEQYRQQAKISLGAELPSLSVSANYLGASIPKIDNFDLQTNAFVLPFILNYEADLLLKNRDKTRSAKKMAEATAWEEKAIYLVLVSDIATVYTNILQYDALINEQEQLLKNYENILTDNNKKFQRGIVNINVLNDSKKEIEKAKTSLENYEKERKVLFLNLAVLTGRSPDCVCNFQRGTLENFNYNSTIPDEIESDVIFSRPDVMASEAKLEKAKIDVRVARKEFLPRFNIVGIWAFNTIAPGSFFSWESSLAAILAGATQDIFMGGRKVANLKFQKAKYEELFENYKQTDLNAVKEVNTALCIIKYDTQVDEQTKQELQLQKNNFINATSKLNRGLIANNEYRYENIKLVNDKKQTIQTKTQKLVNYYTLYKAVGGKI